MKINWGIHKVQQAAYVENVGGFQAIRIPGYRAADQLFHITDCGCAMCVFHEAQGEAYWKKGNPNGFRRPEGEDEMEEGEEAPLNWKIPNGEPLNVHR